MLSATQLRRTIRLCHQRQGYALQLVAGARHRILSPHYCCVLERHTQHVRLLACTTGVHHCLLPFLLERYAISGCLRTCRSIVTMIHTTCRCCHQDHCLKCSARKGEAWLTCFAKAIRQNSSSTHSPLASALCIHTHGQWLCPLHRYGRIQGYSSRYALSTTHYALSTKPAKACRECKTSGCGSWKCHMCNKGNTR